MAGCTTTPGNWQFGASLLGAHNGGMNHGRSDGCGTLQPGDLFPNSSQPCHGHNPVQTYAGCETTAFMPGALNGMHPSKSFGSDRGAVPDATLDHLPTNAGMPISFNTGAIPDATLDHLPTNHGEFVSALDRSYAFNPGIALGTMGGSRNNHTQATMTNTPQPLGTVAAGSNAPQDMLPPPPPPPPPPPKFNFDSPSPVNGPSSPPPQTSLAPPLAPQSSMAPSAPQVPDASIEARLRQLERNYQEASGGKLNTCSSPAPSPGVGSSQQTDAQHRAAWAMDSVLEIYSASTKRWNVAHVIWVAKSTIGPDVLTLQFYQDDGPKNKSLYRNDHQLAAFGAHCASEMPPNCSLVPSQSRPGKNSYFDAINNTKYETAEQAWKVHFERASKNVLPVKPHSSMAPTAAPQSAPTSTITGPGNSGLMPSLQPTPSFPCEAPCPQLAAAFTQMLPHMQAHMGTSAAERAAKAAVTAPRDPWSGGKVALPGFAQPNAGMQPQNGQSDELLITNGVSLAAQLMGNNPVSCGMGMNGGTVRKFEMVK